MVTQKNLRDKSSSCSSSADSDREHNTSAPMTPRRKFNRSSTPLPSRSRIKRYATQRLTQTFSRTPSHGQSLLHSRSPRPRVTRHAAPSFDQSLSPSSPRHPSQFRVTRYATRKSTQDSSQSPSHDQSVLRPRSKSTVRFHSPIRSHSRTRISSPDIGNVIVLESDEEDEGLLEEMVFEILDDDDDDDDDDNEMPENIIHNAAIDTNESSKEEKDENTTDQLEEEIRDSPQSPEPDIYQDLATIGELDLNLERSMFNRIVLLNGLPMMENKYISESEQLEFDCMFSAMCGYRLAINNVYETMRIRGYIEGPPAMAPDDFEQMHHIIRFVNEKIKKYKEKNEKQQQQQ